WLILNIIHADLHLGNILLRLPREFDSLTDDQLNSRYGAPELEPVRRLDGGALPPGVPSFGVKSAWFGKPSEEIRISEAEIFLADFGEAFLPSQESRHESHTPFTIQPPEARFEPDKPLSFPADIWTMACSIWAILGQRPLFEDILATPDNTTCEQVDALGNLPPEWWNKWEARRQWFNNDGSPLKQRLQRTWEDRFEDSIQESRRREGMPVLEAEESDAIFVMLRSMLSFRPETRLTADKVLESKWMKKWALPTYENMRACSGRGQPEEVNI
ncbi:hypothetical protein JDV02_003008, partial [Purpureocillium takamizusanense]